MISECMGCGKGVVLKMVFSTLSNTFNSVN